MTFIAVRPISTDSGVFQGREKHRVQLADGVFCYEISKSTELACAYFPEQQVNVDQAHRFDGRRIIRGVSAPLLALAICVPLMFVLDIYAERGVSDAFLEALAFVLVAPIGLSFVFTAVQIVRFFIRVRTTCLYIESDEGVHEFEFWHPVKKNAALDDLVETLAQNRPEHQPSPSPYMVFEHDWSYTRPIKTAMKMMIAAFFLVWFVLLAAEKIFKSVGIVEMPLPIAIGAFLLIPIAGLASFLFSSYRLAHAEPGHSTALMHFINRDYDLARKDTDHILDAQPDDPDGLMLSIHIRVRQGKLDEIEPFCRTVDELEPEFGAEIFSRIMRVWPDHSEASVQNV
jgi:hypothetical protein